MNKFPHLSLLILLMLPLSLRGMEIEKEPVRGPVISGEARARAREATDGEDAGGTQIASDQARGSIGDGRSPKETGAVTPSDATPTDSFAVKQHFFCKIEKRGMKKFEVMV